MKSNEQILADNRVFNFKECFGMNTALVHLQMVGTCSVVWGTNEDGYDHVSISPTHKFRIPSWDDMCELKDIFFEDEEEVYQIMPKKSEYVNIMNNCLHLWMPSNHKTLNDVRLLQ